MVSGKKKILIYIILIFDGLVIILSTLYFYAELANYTPASIIHDSCLVVPNNNEQHFETKNNLSMFLVNDSAINSASNSIVASLGKDELIGQQIVTSLGSKGKSWEQVRELMLKKQIGGILLTGGSINEEIEYVRKIRETERENKLIPVLISFDGEPFLIDKRLGINILPRDGEIHSITELELISVRITKILKSININQNFAPVCDIPIKGSLVERRSFSYDSNVVRLYSLLFTLILQQNGIVATGKHFPGHGNVVGDSHKEIVFIDGELKELKIFKSLIDKGILSIMVGHIAIRNNPRYDTDGLPSSLSRKIVSGLLREELNFKGIIVTDAMNMGAVSKREDKPSLSALKAGCDMVLIPSDELKLIESVKSEMENNSEFASQVYDSVKRIIKLKKCLGLL